MMKKARAIILINLCLVLLFVGYNVMAKQQLLKEGKLIFLALAPTDPRSLMQGDYMTLRYEITDGVVIDSIPQRGYCVVATDSSGRVVKARFQQAATPKATGEYSIRYRVANKWSISIGAESYFFEEGQAAKYASAIYGGLRVDEDGNSILAGLYDEQLEKIE